MNCKLLFLFFAIGLAAPALGYSAGAPTDACNDMKPQHGVDPQKSDAPYTFAISRKTIRSGDEVTLTITGKSSTDKIRGFMIQARQGNRRVGHFKIDPSDSFVQALDCDGIKASAVTHLKHEEKDDKRSFTVTWVSPKDFKNEVVFRNTIALNGGVFWVGEESDKIKVY